MPTAAILNQERERWARNQISVLSAQTSVFSGALPKQTNKTGGDLTASQSAFAGVLNKITAMGGSELAASMSAFVGALTKQTNKILAATQSAFSGSLAKLAGKVLAATESAFVGSLVKQTNKILSATQSAFVGSLVKLTNKILSGTQTAFSGVLTASHLFLQVLAATMSAFSGSLSKLTLVPLAASMSAFAGSISKQTRKVLSAVASVWSWVFTAIKQGVPPVPPPPITLPSGRLIATFGVSESKPALISMSASGTQTFLRSVPVQIMRADNWQRPGQQAMGGLLLVASGAGTLSGHNWTAIAKGVVTIPNSSAGILFGISLFENYFSPNQGDVVAQAAKSLDAGQANWSIVCKLSGNSKGSGSLKGDYTVVINDTSFTGTLYSNYSNFVEPKLQLSIQSSFTGSLTPPDLFQVTMTQFDLIQQ